MLGVSCSFIRHAPFGIPYLWQSHGNGRESIFSFLSPRSYCFGFAAGDPVFDLKFNCPLPAERRTQHAAHFLHQVPDKKLVFSVKTKKSIKSF